MNTQTPKVLHSIAGKPMLGHVLDTVCTLAGDKVGGEGARIRPLVVLDPDAAPVTAYVQHAFPGIDVIHQVELRGTGHAVSCCMPMLAAETPDDVIVVFGDTPLIRPEVFAALLASRKSGADVVILGFRPDNPGEYGRLVTDDGGELIRIVEASDTDYQERAVTLCNGGAMAVAGEHLGSLVNRLADDNAQGEYYLTDIVALARQDGLVCRVVEGHEEDATGVNDRIDLARTEAVMQNRLRARVLAHGATLEVPESVYLCHDTALAADVTVEPYVVFGPGVRVEAGARIRSFSHLEGVVIEAEAQIGPFARLRPESRIAAGARVGNFVEVKNASVGKGAKINHLSYVGDASVGVGVNIGAGVITCNYDGVNKHHTEIGDHAFIGSNSALVAPVSIGQGAYVGSGSTITRDVEEEGLAIARARQDVKPGLARRFRKSRGKKG